MKNTFGEQVNGVSPEQTRAALSQGQHTSQTPKTMVEQEQIFPELKPHGFGEDIVDRQQYQARLNEEQTRMTRYQIRVTEIHSRYHLNGQLVSSKTERQVSPMMQSKAISHDFNMQSAQAQDVKELGLAYS